ncbi:MAG TPA: right-handed parallel beta-helix repeat-containing protein [Planctomycetota bacterium]|nr:right-handed parallel beta-helix repeat-containing protein [Planctomycetota bacterium]
MIERLGLALACAMVVASPAVARDISVSSETGSNDAAGTKEAPKKLLWKVMSELQPGDRVHVAEGRQEGQSKSGVMPKCDVSNVVLEGGWAKDFSERDPFKHLTIIGPPDDQQGAGVKVIHFESSDNKIADVTIDGFAIDRGGSNYYFSDGEPGANKRIEGHFDNSAWGFRDLNRKKSGSDPTIVLIGRGSFTVRNCLLVNNPWWGIYVKGGGNGTITIENNLILVSQGRGIESITGGGWGKPTHVIRNNTVAFSHTLKSTEGRALSTDPKDGQGGKYVVENNVFAFSDGAGVDTKFDVKGDALALTNNLFFFNRRGDAATADEKGSNAADLGDNVSYKTSGNVHELPKFVAKMAKAWVDRWSSREFIDMLAGSFNKPEELAAARAALGLGEYEIPGYEKKFPTYKDLPQSRNSYDMSRYPRPMKKGEGMSWAEAVVPLVGADAPRGIRPYAPPAT